VNEQEREDLDELLELLRKGDTVAIRKVLECYPQCRAVLSRMGIPSEGIQDIFQNSIIALYEKLQEGNLVLTVELCTYVCSICKYQGLDWLRKKKRKDTKLSDFKRDSVDQDTSEALNLPSEKEILDAIESLGAPCKELLIAFYYHKVSIKELREKHGYKTENAAKVAKHKCMKRLKKLLTQKKS
jgi:RNA polymerase sigma factor (sigma-70 family)